MGGGEDRKGIVCAGAWCVDRNIVIDHWPTEETVATMLAEARHGGCPGHNMATALRRLGATFPVEAIGLTGDDEDGRLLAGICDELAIDRRQLVKRSDSATAYTNVMIAKPTGRRTFFYSPGAHDLLSPEHFDFSDTRCRIVHLGLPGLHQKLDAPWKGDPSGWVTVLKKARARGLKTNIELVSIGPDRIRAAVDPMLAYLDTLIINDWEAGALARLETVRDGVTDHAACREAAGRIIERSIAWLVAIHFPMGGIIATRDGRLYEHPSVDVPPDVVRSSNGAGDSFAAGILFGVHEGWPLERALVLAHASAAASLRAESTTGAIAPWQECLALAERWGWRKG
jgi:sugar/nucleoside kinase (ribokinase family)